MNLAAQTGVSKLCGLINIIKYNGGLTKLLRQLYRINDEKSDQWIEETLNNNYKAISECFRLAKNNPEDPLVTARLLRWFNYITKDCFLLVPAKRLTSSDEDLQLSKLNLNSSALQLIPPMNIWDCFSIVLSPETVEMTKLLSSERSDIDSMHYYLAITNNNGEGSADSDDGVVSHLPRASVIRNLSVSSTVSGSIYSCNDRASIREHLTNRNLSTQRSKIYLESCTMRRCTTKTCSRAGILSSTREKLGSRKKTQRPKICFESCTTRHCTSKTCSKAGILSIREKLGSRKKTERPKICFESCTMRRCTTKTCSKAGIVSSTPENLGSRKKHIGCSSELETESSKPSKGIRRRFTSKKNETVRIDVGKKEEKDKKLQLESKISADDLSKAMELPGEENKIAVVEHLVKQSECNNVIIESKEIAANSTAISQETDNLSSKSKHCRDAGKLSCSSDCKPKSCGGQHSGCKSGGQEHGDGCGEKKPGCGKKPEGGCGGDSPKKGDKCGGSGKDEGACVPNMHRKLHPCEKEPAQDEIKDEKESSRNAKSKVRFNKKLKETRVKYKIDHCRKSKIVWGRSDFNKKARNKSNETCADQRNPLDDCHDH